MKFLLVVITIVCIILLTGINKKQVPQTYEEWQRQHGQKTAQKDTPAKQKKKNNSFNTISYKKIVKPKPVPQSYEEWTKAQDKKSAKTQVGNITFEKPKKKKKVPQSYEEWALTHPMSEEDGIKKLFTRN